MATANIYVSPYQGAAPIGTINAKAGMVTNRGKIHDVSGEIVIIGGPSGNFYDHDCVAVTGHLMASFSWPTGDGSIQFSRVLRHSAGTGVFPNGVLFNQNAATGSAFFNGTTTTTFGR